VAQQNKVLTGKLSASEQRAADLEKQLAAKSGESSDAKILRAELAHAQQDLDRANKAGAKADDAARQNKDLNAKLTVAQQRVADLEKQVAGRSATPANAAQLKQLQADLADARTQLDRTKKASADTTALVKQNQDLATQLAAAKGQGAQLEQARTELAGLRAEAETAKIATARAADLQKQNNELNDKLEEAKKGPYIRPLTTEESADIRQLKIQVENMRDETEQARRANARLDALTKENAELQASLRQASPVLTEKDAAAVKKLRDENSYLRNLLEEYAAKSPELKPELKKFQSAEPAVEKPATPPAGN
jgi:DNA repair exonuclease SbcCD ATPase subunit